jgi:transposase
MRSRAASSKDCVASGRAPVRDALYTAAMSAGNWNPVLNAFRKRLKDAGKMAKVVIVAVNAQDDHHAQCHAW